MFYARLKVKYGIDLPVRTHVGKGFVIFHGFGLVINGDAIIGEYVTMMHNTTIGINKTGGGCPTIGNHVKVGAGTIILRKINIGKNAVIGAGSVITKDVPEKVLIVGNPAKIIKNI